jgi:hypothetical protein
VILAVSHTLISQPATAEKTPVHVTASGRRMYRQRQLEVVANARSTRALGAATWETFKTSSASQTVCCVPA